jgi:AcrR family transcriptional regulator
MEVAAIAPETAEPGEQTATQDGGAKRRQVLDGARSVFLSDGFDGASMNDIAKVAGVSKGTLYVYFESKEALFEALIREDRKQQAEQLIPAEEPRDARAFLGGYGRQLIELLTRPDLLAQSRMVISAIVKFPRFGEAFFDSGPRYGTRILASALEKLVRAGELEIDDLELAAQQFAGLCKGGVFHCAIFCGSEAVQPEDIERTVNGAVDVFMAAYGPRR